jgi:hypothetical protein
MQTKFSKLLKLREVGRTGTGKIGSLVRTPCTPDAPPIYDGLPQQFFKPRSLASSQRFTKTKSVRSHLHNTNTRKETAAGKRIKPMIRFCTRLRHARLHDGWIGTLRDTPVQKAPGGGTWDGIGPGPPCAVEVPGVRAAGESGGQGIDLGR